MFASVLGFLFTLFLLIMIGGGLLISLASSAESTEVPTIHNNSVLHLEFQKEIRDRPSNDPFENFDFFNLEDKSPTSLSSIIENIEKAAEDDRIKGIYLDIEFLRANLSSTDAIRRSLENFKESGKFIVAYGESFSQTEYYLNSVADKIYLHPSGELTFKGLAAQLMFFKDAFERIDLDMQIIRHGKFKSAVEPFIRNDMSPENEAQLKQLIDGIWEHQLTEIADARSLSLEKLNEYADNLMIRTAADAKELGLVDDLLYEDEVKQIIMQMVHEEELTEDVTEFDLDDLELLALGDLSKVKKQSSELSSEERENRRSKDKIALVFAEGEIVSGKSKEGYMGSETIAQAIRDARNDKNVKAIVLRVNSPGGSALASDVIWRETVLAKQEKPLVVSMGDVAASGGYYISCGADKIYAEKTTITGSIGVFGIIPNMEGMLSNKLGIHIDQVGTNRYSDGITLLRPLSETEIIALTEMVEDVYDTFTRKVAEGRKMQQSNVDSIGQGRVWSGMDAAKIGLVDELGGLEDAIAAAAELAEIETYKMIELPKREDPMQKFIKEFSAQAYVNLFGNPLLGKAEKYYHNIKQVVESEGIYTRLPVGIIIE